MTAGVAPERTYALVVGVERYEASEDWDLNGPASDAWQIANWLTRSGVPASQICLHLSPVEAMPKKEDLGELAVAAVDQLKIFSASGEAVERSLTALHSHQGDLLFIFWGGHGVIDTNGDRRLFYSNAVATNQQNLDLDGLLHAMRTTYFGGFRRQICIVDACANFFERSGKHLPPGGVARGSQLFPEPEQFVLLAARAGEAAKNESQERTGQFSKILLELLWDRQWPVNMARLAHTLKMRFKRLRKEKETRQTPIYWWRRSWEGDIQEEGSAWDLLAASEERNMIFNRQSRREIEAIASHLVSEEDLKKLYRQSLPTPGLLDSQATTLPYVLFVLADLNSQAGGAFPVPLLEFVERLALHLEAGSSAEASRLRDWVDRAGERVKIATGTIQSLRDQLRKGGSDGDSFHLLVEVKPDQLEPKRFSLATFSWSRAQEFESIDFMPEASSSFPLSDIEGLVVQLVEKKLPELLPEGTSYVVVELFLPRELLCWRVDQLKIRKGKASRPIGIYYQVIVRWRDRAWNKTWDLDWKRKWRRVQAKTHLPDSILWILAREQYRLNELYAKLIGPEDHCCLGLAFSPPETPESLGAEDLLDTILESGVPVAFWLRQPWADPDDLQQQIARICEKKRVADLPQVVLDARRKAYGCDDMTHMGHHLTLLWDDADRRLPGSIQPRLVRPRVEGGRP